MMATGPLEDIVIIGPKLEKNAEYLDHTLGHAAGKIGKHPVDVMLDMAVEEDLKTEFFAAPPNGRIDYLREIVDDHYVLFGVSDDGGKMVPAARRAMTPGGRRGWFGRCFGRNRTEMHRFSTKNDDSAAGIYSKGLSL